MFTVGMLPPTNHQKKTGRVVIIIIIFSESGLLLGVSNAVNVGMLSSQCWLNPEDPEQTADPEAQKVTTGCDLIVQSAQ